MGPAKTAEVNELDEKLLKAISHPLRLDALRRIGEKGEASPAEIAREISKPVANVAHHIRVLVECDCIEEVRTRQVRGATEHFFRATRKARVPDTISECLPRVVREQISDTMLSVILERVALAVEQGTVDRRPDRYIGWMQVKLDEQGWRELMAAKVESLEREERIAAEAGARLAAKGDQPINVFTSSLGFEAPRCS